MNSFLTLEYVYPQEGRFLALSHSYLRLMHLIETNSVGHILFLGGFFRHIPFSHRYPYIQLTAAHF